MEGNAVPALSRSWNVGEQHSGAFQELECASTLWKENPGQKMGLENFFSIFLAWNEFK